ncbi:hypothetical protein M3Y97_01084900 [Aphelenchoides bicaudatus]|nr:hypothetical protein M3Y97_01084900 [Aphelenchoides bicaudatus]
MARTNTTSLEEWTNALPTDSEKNEMFELISMLYPMETYDNLNNSLLTENFPHLAKVMQLTVLENRFCVIHEPLDATSPSFKFPRFFGFIVLRAEQGVSKRLHHSAAHFETDGHVCRQASAMFSQTGSKSLVVAGASRWAVKGSNPSPCQRSNQIADASHNTDLMFHVANVALWEAAKRYSTSRQNLIDHFIQWHGMAETSCPNSMAFISVGASLKHSVYQNDNLYANRLKSSLNQITGYKFAQTPQTDMKCSLRATTNVFGRVINGVHVGDECLALAPSKSILGNFIHIEQKNQSREDLSLWVKALNRIQDDTPSRSSRNGFHPRAISSKGQNGKTKHKKLRSPKNAEIKKRRTRKTHSPLRTRKAHSPQRSRSNNRLKSRF